MKMEDMESDEKRMKKAREFMGKKMMHTKQAMNMPEEGKKMIREMMAEEKKEKMKKMEDED